MAPTFAKRLQIALAGYGLVGVFGVVFWALRDLKELSSLEQLILSAIVVAPLALALLWEHLKSLKIGEIEITLKGVRVLFLSEVAVVTIRLSDLIDLRDCRSQQFPDSTCRQSERVQSMGCE